MLLLIWRTHRAALLVVTPAVRFFGYSVYVWKLRTNRPLAVFGRPQSVRVLTVPMIVRLRLLLTSRFADTLSDHKKYSVIIARANSIRGILKSIRHSCRHHRRAI